MFSVDFNYIISSIMKCTHLFTLVQAHLFSAFKIISIVGYEALKNPLNAQNIRPAAS